MCAEDNADTADTPFPKPCLAASAVTKAYTQYHQRRMAAAIAENAKSAVVTFQTQVTFIYCRYRMVMAVDVSPSLFSVDAASGFVLFDVYLASFKVWLAANTYPSSKSTLWF